MTPSFGVFAVFALLLAIPAVYYLIVGKNLIRILISIELLFKAVTLLIAGAGYFSGRVALVQSLIITLILIEVLVTAIGAGIIIAYYRHSESLDATRLKELKG